MSLKKYLFLLVLTLKLVPAEAHPLPQCKAQMIVNKENVLIHFKAPVEIVELAKRSSIKPHNQASIDSLKSYVLRHISITDSLKSKWQITIGNVLVQEANDQLIGNYLEIIIDIILTPSNAESLQDFTMNCDLIIHQIPTQSIIFSVEKDWQNGISTDNAIQIGVIAVDIPTGKIFPFHVKLEKGSWFKGFKSMVSLGVSHIAEGTDHILFVLTLLLPAMLTVDGSRRQAWGHFAGTRASLTNLLKIVTAFTVGHSLTLLLGTVKWLSFPTKPIEVLIAITILISAFHALRPIYPKREIFVAGGFGLIHGLAFAETLTNLQLSTKQLVLSILGFNVGIELMQLFIILLIFPVLLLLSRTRYYTRVRQVGAIAMMIVAFAWMIERIQEKPNFITQYLG